MDVRNCKSCGKLYNYIGGPYRTLCPECIKKLEEKFIEVKEYIRENTTATTADVSENCGVRVEQIERWVREERLYFSDDSPIGIPCEGCGKTIKTGHFCASCKSKMANDLSGLYSEEPEDDKKSDRERNSKLSKEFIKKVNSEK